ASITSYVMLIIFEACSPPPPHSCWCWQFRSPELRVVAARLPPTQQALRPGLPRGCFGSDHLLLAADLSWTSRDKDNDESPPRRVRAQRGPRAMSVG
ncbi:MAG: hypothetical protein MHM6MM_007807, partial [Cercozoa sp. M6MM]